MGNKTVFISYKSEDMAHALWVRNALESSGVSCWMAPESIVGGASYAAEIPAAIRNASAFVLVLSTRTMASKWVAKEVSLAINEGKTVMPFLLEPCTLTDEFNFYLTDVQWYQAWQGRDAAMSKMIREIRSILGLPAQPAAAQVRSTPIQTVSTGRTAPTAAGPARAPQPARVQTGAAVRPAAADKTAVAAGLFGILALISGGVLILPEILAFVLALRAAPRLAGDERGRKWANAALIGGSIGTAIILTAAAAVVGTAIAVAVVVFVVKRYRRALAK